MAETKQFNILKLVSKLNYDVLDDLEQRKLIADVQRENNEKSLQQLCIQYGKLIIKIKNKYSSKLKDSVFEDDDLVNEAYLAFIKAIKKFNLESKNSVSTYVTSCIEGSLKNFINKNVNQTSQDIRKLLTMVNEIKIDLQNKYFRTPTDKEIYDELQKRTTKRIEYNDFAGLLKGKIKLVSMEAKETGEKDKTEYIDLNNVISPIDYAYFQTNKEMIYKLLPFLNDAQRTIITMRYGIGETKAMSCQEVANELGVTKQRVNQIEHAAIAIMIRNKNKI